MLSFSQAELFASRLQFAIPVLQTFPVQADEAALLASRCSELHFHQQSSITGDTIRAVIAELINRNRYFQDAAAELSVHPDLTGNNKIQISISLRPTAKFSPNKSGVPCRLARNIYLQSVPAHVVQSQSDVRPAICHLEPDGYIHNTNYGSIAVIKGESYCIPRIPSLSLSSPMAQLAASVAQQIGMTVISSNISEQDLLEADEVLMPSSMGILDWCTAYQNRRYFNRKFKQIASAIIESTENPVQKTAPKFYSAHHL